MGRKFYRGFRQFCGNREWLLRPEASIAKYLFSVYLAAGAAPCWEPEASEPLEEGLAIGRLFRSYIRVQTVEC